MTRDDTIKPAPAGGQTQRLPGGSRDALLHNQLYRYAEDLQQTIERLDEVDFEKQIFSIVFDNASDGVMITDIEGVILAVNPAFARVTGYEAAEVIGQTPRFLKSGSQDSSFYTHFWRALQEQGSWEGAIHNRRKDGSIYAEWLKVRAAYDKAGNVLCYVAIFFERAGDPATPSSLPRHTA